MGIARQVITESCIINPSEELYYPTDRDVELNHTNVLKYSIQNHGKEYVKFFREVMANG